MVDDEIKDLRAQVAKEKSDSSDGDNASILTAPATQVDYQPDIGEGGLVFDPTAPTLLNPGPFEGCDEDMLCSASEAEDEREVRRNGIWERRRSGVIKKGKLLKFQEKAKAKQNKSIIIEEEGEVPPPDPPVAGKHLADVLNKLVSGGFKRSIVSLPAFFFANGEFVWGSRSSFAFWVAGLPGCFQKALKLSPTAAISNRLLSAAALKHLF